ncbi:hypothetical protein [Undibacterium sp. TS12]|uniref:hypothetical protein n=1 Tax=Undibacterium sp. TS12 TaxID=2908202 RepID=UPI001F4CF6DE|nr:hypothetical protein [Undibacterium sp. TS12]MCH8620663.1 hypothetical protein [Undibacterium sp. TS12]
MSIWKEMLPVMMTAVLLLSGCASKKQPEIASFTFPEIGTIATKGIGESLLTQGMGQLEPSLVIAQNEMIGSIPLLKGEYPFEAENKTRIKFVKDKVEVYLYKAENKICFSKEQCADIKYSLINKLARKSANAFQQTLLYNGKIGNRITLAYREFSNNLARPAFNNEVTYDLDESSILGYKGARIEIVKATNTEITYKILSGFD